MSPINNEFISSYLDELDETITENIKIYDLNISDALNLALEKDIYRQLCFNPSASLNTNVKSMMTGDWENSTIESFNILKNIILDIFNIYINHDTRKFCIDVMWGSVYRSGGYTQWHDHIGSAISFVYFLKAPENSSTLDMLFWGKRNGNFDKGIVRVKPKVGRLIIFPSSVKHKVDPYYGKENRITIAGDINLLLTM
jgi:predicted 2-oxoglutarate/Fe(II)-dependent dioxygenase YbiX